MLAGVVSGALMAGAAALLALAQSKPLTVAINGEAYPARTRAATVGDVLRELAVVVGDGDQIAPAPGSPITSDMIIRVERARAVRLIVDGRAQIVQTALSHPAEILDRARVSVAPNDRIVLDGTLADVDMLARWPVPVGVIQVRHAIRLPIDDAGRRSSIETTADTVGDALFAAGITLYLADVVTPGLNTPIPLTDGVRVRIERATPVQIAADGVQTRTRVAGVTVGDALADAGIALVGLDRVSPAEAVRLNADMSIRVVRVREEIGMRIVDVPFATLYEPDTARAAGERYTAVEGQLGIGRVQIRVRYEDGIAVSERVEVTTLLLPPQDRLIRYGVYADDALTIGAPTMELFFP